MKREEQIVGIAAKMYAARETSRNLMGDGYADAIAPHVAALKQAAKDSGKSLLQVCIDTTKRLADEGRDMAIMSVLAATVEAIEEEKGKSAEKILNDIVNPKDPTMTTCATCADCVGGFCLSSDLDSRKFYDIWHEREGQDPPDCDAYREKSERPGPDENTQYCWEKMLRAEVESSEWSNEGDPENYIQRRADDSARAWRGGRSVMPMLEADEYPQRPGCSSGEVMGRIIVLLQECPELEKAKGHRYRLTWRLSKWYASGGPVWGQSKPIPVGIRQKYGITSTWDLTLSLPVWLLLDDAARDRLLHHELMHAATLDKGHPVAEFPETVARFGLWSADQAKMAIAAFCHPAAMEKIERWGLLPARVDGIRQLTMFESPGLETVEVRVPMREEVRR